MLVSESLPLHGQSDRLGQFETSPAYRTNMVTACLYIDSDTSEDLSIYNYTYISTQQTGSRSDCPPRPTRVPESMFTSVFVVWGAHGDALLPLFSCIRIQRWQLASTHPSWLVALNYWGRLFPIAPGDQETTRTLRGDDFSANHWLRSWCCASCHLIPCSLPAFMPQAYSLSRV